MSTPEHAKSVIPSLDPATGMKLGQRYRVEPTESGHPFEGFFLDGKYFLNADLLTAVGWLEGQRFIYDQVDGKGEPVFAERHAGGISDLNLTVVDGPVLALTPMDEIEDQAATGSGKDEQGQAADADADAHGSQQKRASAERATGQPDEAADADDSGKTGENEGTNDEREASAGDDDTDDADGTDGTDDTLESDKSEASACPVSQSTNLLLTGIAGLAIGLLIGVSISRHDR
ncbi:hypothetical protein [Pseudomonas sp.]|uniref:hypothetical protein n=1 Tax=Pseudomonas sp. TaxID=306 RepID=UPI0028AE0A32|nr:hypothetical protein [Pseudomonas sp.]